MLYKIEIFTTAFVFIDAAAVEQPDVRTDALTIENSSFVLNGVHQAIKKGHLACVTNSTGDVVFQGFVEDVGPKENKTTVTCRPLISMLDINVYFDRTLSHNLETFFAGIVTAYYKTNADTLQNITGITVTAQTSTVGYLNLKTNIGNLYDMIVKALKMYSVYADLSFDAGAKTFSVTFAKVTDTVTVEADLAVVLDKTVKIGDASDELNKITIINAANESQKLTYFRHTNGTIDTNNTDRITPVVFDVSTLQQEEGSGQTFEQSAYAKAYEALKVSEYANEISLLYPADCEIMPSVLKIGMIGNIIVQNTVYRSILTGFEKTEHTVRLYFGYIRGELTKKILMQKRAEK